MPQILCLAVILLAASGEPQPQAAPQSSPQTQAPANAAPQGLASGSSANAFGSVPGNALGLGGPSVGGGLGALAAPLPANAGPPKALPQGSSGGVSSAGAHRSGTATAIGTRDVKVEGFKTADGKTGWKARIPGGRALATPAVVDGMAFVGGGFGSHEFYAFDAASGKPAWALRLSDDGPTAAVVSEGRVIFNTESCTLFVVDAKTGKHVWSRWLGDPLMSQPAVHQGVVYMAYPASDGHRLIALALKDGAKRFEVPIAGDIISAPVVEGDSVYLTTFDGTVYRHGLTDGALVWKKQMQATSAPWIQDGEVHVAQRVDDGARRPTEGVRTMSKGGAAAGNLKSAKPAPHLDAQVQDRSGYAAKQASDDTSVGFGGGAPAIAKGGMAKANVGTGTVRGLWEYQGSRPMKVSGKQMAATQGDVVRGIDAESGKVLWEKKLEGDLAKVGGQLASPPAFAAGKLVIGTAAGQVVGFEAESGKELFRYPVGEEIRFQPALVGGRIFVGTSAGTLVSIATGDESLDGWTMWGGGPEHNGPRELPLKAAEKKPEARPESAPAASPN
jgi:Ca-activated chloride channel family protein